MRLLHRSQIQALSAVFPLILVVTIAKTLVAQTDLGWQFGDVTAITAGHVTLAASDGTTLNITLPSTTEFRQLPPRNLNIDSAKVIDQRMISVGDHLMVKCSQSGPNTFTASRVFLIKAVDGAKSPPAPATQPQQNSPPSETQTNASSATLAETAAWLTSNLVGLHASYERNYVSLDKKTKLPNERTRKLYKTDDAVLGARLDGCRLSLSVLQTTGTDNWKSTEATNYQLPLDQLDPAIIHLNDHSTGHVSQTESTSYSPTSYTMVMIGAPNEVIVRSWKKSVTSYTGSPPIPDESEQGVTNNLVLASDDPVFAKRILNALNHAIELCHASKKAEPF